MRMGILRVGKLESCSYGLGRRSGPLEKNDRVAIINEGIFALQKRDYESETLATLESL